MGECEPADLSDLGWERTIAFTDAAFRFVGDVGAWSRGDYDERELLESLAREYRDQYGEEAMNMAGVFMVASFFLHDLATTIAEQEGKPGPWVDD